MLTIMKLVLIMIPKQIKNILNTIEQNGFEAYLVGGFVRDTLLHQKTNDFDIATNALPKDLTKIFGPQKQNLEYGSYHLKVSSYTVDITTYRKEVSYENHRPIKLEFTQNILEDAKRRDFTVNALYMNKNEELMDPYGYEKDVKEKILRTIGNPKVRLQEDITRLLRAVRFASSYDFTMEKSLKEAILKEKKRISEIPLPVIKKELDAILLADGFSLLKNLHLLKELGIKNTNIIYVNDLVGLWSQIKTTIPYPQTKNFQKREKNMKKMLNCGTINILDLYHYGYYDCFIASSILKIPSSVIEKMWEELPIHSRKEIVLSALEMKEISGLQHQKLGNLIQEVETQIVTHKLKNTKEDIEYYLKKR